MVYYTGDKHPHIQHQWDIWHGAKNLGKKWYEVSLNKKKHFNND